MTVYTNGDDERNNKYTDPNDMLQKKYNISIKQ